MKRYISVWMLLVAAAGLLPVAPAVAQNFQVNIGLGTPPLPPVVVTTPPRLVVVPGTAVYYAPDLPTNYFFYQGHYYTVGRGVWSMAPAYNGPWVVIEAGKVPPPVLTVPVEYYKIPPGHLKQPGPPPWAGHGHGPKPKKVK